MKRKRQKKNKSISPRDKFKFTSKITDLLCVSACMVLHDKFGFGKERLDRFMRELMKTMESINQNYCSLPDLYETLTEETKIDFDKY